MDINNQGILYPVLQNTNHGTIYSPDDDGYFSIDETLPTFPMMDGYNMCPFFVFIYNKNGELVFSTSEANWIHHDLSFNLDYTYLFKMTKSWDELEPTLED